MVDSPAIFALHITGERAFFARPEFRRDRVSYDLIPPRAARGLFDAIHWRPTIRWCVEQIRICSPGTAEMVPGGVEGGTGRTLILRDVGYVIRASLHLLPGAPEGETLGEHVALFRRRSRRPRPGTKLYLGRPDFAAAVELLEPSLSGPQDGGVDADFGWMPVDTPYCAAEPLFFRAIAKGGLVTVPQLGSEALFA